MVTIYEAIIFPTFLPVKKMLLGFVLPSVVNFIFFIFIPFFMATRAAYGSSQARVRITAAAAGLCQSNTGCEPCLQPTPQLKTKPDP